MRNLLVAPVLAIAFCTPALAEEEWRVSGFSTPESVVYDGQNQRLIVSNIIGEPTGVDGEGSLSLVGMDGELIDAEWVTGLDAPKGSAIVDGTLFVADITNLRIVDLASGEYETVAVDGAGFLNDVTADADGNVYVTDTFSNRIYRYSNDMAEVFVEDAALDNPNGILFDGDRLVVASFGVLAEAPEDMVPGGLVSIDIESRAVAPIEGTEGTGFLDGIVKIGEAFILSDFFAGTIISFTPGSAPEVISTLAMGSADIGTDGEAIFVPMMMEGELVKLTLQ